MRTIGAYHFTVHQAFTSSQKNILEMYFDIILRFGICGTHCTQNGRSAKC
nr:MAG TPA: hypothetical protein [Bacteriophage sp.]